MKIIYVDVLSLSLKQTNKQTHTHTIYWYIEAAQGKRSPTCTITKHAHFHMFTDPKHTRDKESL